MKARSVACRRQAALRLAATARAAASASDRAHVHTMSLSSGQVSKKTLARALLRRVWDMYLRLVFLTVSSFSVHMTETAGRKCKT